jgi:MarR family transcriptional regulator, transcriptional regulator for hemolysin
MLQSEMPLWRQWEMLSRRYKDVLAKKLGHLGIERHFYLMLAIDEGAENFTQQDLADILEIDKVLMVGILNYLGEKGFVKRKENKQDGRKHRIVLTAKAKAALPEIRKTISESNREALSGLSPELSRKFPEILRTIRTTLEKTLGTEKSPGKRLLRKSIKSRPNSRAAKNPGPASRIRNG